jgi:hypothetical protein
MGDFGFGELALTGGCVRVRLRVRASRHMRLRLRPCACARNVSNDSELRIELPIAKPERCLKVVLHSVVSRP